METGFAFASLNPDAEGRFVSLRRELGVTSFGINQVLLRPGQRGRIHRHEHQEEVYVVLQGTLTLLIEGEPRELRQGDLARVAPDVRRQLQNRHGEPLLILAAGSAHEHVGRDGRAYRSWDESGEGHAPADVALPDDIPRAS
jgi:mannose-6-phosphate isomerase-like protein (cupin superfamily)